jgi:hypothetical protein
MSLYPRADLDAVGEGFVASCIDEGASKLVEDCCDSRTHHRDASGRYFIG